MQHSHSHIQALLYAGRPCLQLTTRHGRAILALHGAQLLSWEPTGHQDVFWLSPARGTALAPLRGGVPICWPWFGKQAMPAGAMQHGPVRNWPWEVVCVHADGREHVSLTLAPCRAVTADDALTLFADNLQVTVQIDLGETLVQTLKTHNRGSEPFVLTQALHSYFAVRDATHVRITELAGLQFDDKLTGAARQIQAGPFALERACDRVYQQHTPTPTHVYTLEDYAGQRRIHIRTEGSQSLVVWNPGQDQAGRMVDVPGESWRNFLCVEAANAGTDVVTMQPGSHHQLIQTLSAEHWGA